MMTTHFYTKILLYRHKLTMLIGLVGVCVFFLVASLNSCSSPTDQNPLGVDFYWRNPIIDGGSKFTGVVTNFTGDRSSLKWSWDFGDGVEDADPYSKTLPSPYHTFPAAGTYRVTLTVTASDGQGGTMSSVVTKDVTVKYFANVPSVRIDSLVPSIFGFMIKGVTDKGEKYEYGDPNPDFLLEISKSPLFDTLIPFTDETDAPTKYTLYPGAGFRLTFENLDPNETYYARIRIIRYSLSKANVITDVSENSTPIQKFRTLPLPEIQIAVDTTTNAELIFIGASLPGLDVPQERQVLTIFRDNSTIPLSAESLDSITYARDSIFYREPSTSLTFRYRFVYQHPTKSSITVEREAQVTVATPAMIFHFTDSTFQADKIYSLGKRITGYNNLREIKFQDGIGVTIQWNRSPKDNGTYLIDDEYGEQLYRTDGVYFGQPITSTDVFSYLAYSVNNITYYHTGLNENNGSQSQQGTMVVYKEDDDYIYARMSMDNVLYRKGFKMVSTSSTGQQSFKNVYLRGFVFKVKKDF